MSRKERKLRNLIREEVEDILTEAIPTDYIDDKKNISFEVAKFVEKAEMKGDGDKIGEIVAHIISTSVPPEYWGDIKSNLKTDNYGM